MNVGDPGRVVTVIVESVSGYEQDRRTEVLLRHVLRARDSPRARGIHRRDTMVAGHGAAMTRLSLACPGLDVVAGLTTQTQF